MDVRRPGKPVVIEGQSGTGKTTCIKKILDHIGSDLSAKYLSARDAANVAEIGNVATGRIPGTFVIDDYHRLALDVQQALGNIAKLAADQGSATSSLPKLVLIGGSDPGWRQRRFRQAASPTSPMRAYDKWNHKTIELVGLLRRGHQGTNKLAWQDRDTLSGADVTYNLRESRKTTLLHCAESTLRPRTRTIGFVVTTEEAGSVLRNQSYGYRLNRVLSAVLKISG